jgi:hypothetical protein
MELLPWGAMVEVMITAVVKISVLITAVVKISVLLQDMRDAQS